MSATGAVSALRLYRQILTLHRRVLPTSHRSLGDTYVQEEFKAHKSATTEQVSVFMAEWRRYAEMLAQQREEQDSQAAQGKVPTFEAPTLTAEQLESMNEEQRQQLMELRSAAYDPVKA